MITINPGDVVFHRPTRETWMVRYVRGDRLAWLGWPPGEARLSDCLLVEKDLGPRGHTENEREAAHG